MNAIMKRRVLLIIMTLLMLVHAPLALAAPSDYDINTPENLQEDYLYGTSCAVLDADTGRVLFSKNPDLIVYPASTTKIMTLLLALESDISLDQMVTIPQDAYNVPSDSSIVPVKPGEEMSFEDLLYGLQLKSGNDAAMSIAVLVSGSVSNFVALMNQRAAELGCTSTHFVNPHGYHDDGHYTTVNDMSRIAMEALKNPEFRQIVSTRTYTMAATSLRDPLTISNSYLVMDPDSMYYYSDCIGIKSGYHSKAGYCFVGAAERDGLTLLSLSMNSGTTNRETSWIDTIRLMKYGFLQYNFMDLDSLLPALSASYSSVTVENAADNDPGQGLLALDAVQLNEVDYQIPVYKDSDSYYATLSQLRQNTTVNMVSNLKAPIEQGEVVGTLTVNLDADTYVSLSLVASRSVAARPERLTLNEIFPFLSIFEQPIVRTLLLLLVALFVILILLSAYRKHVQRKRKRMLYERRRREYLRQQRQNRSRKSDRERYRR